MCMKPRAISRESATSMGTSGHVRTADMLECKGFALVMHEVHGSPCAPANIVIIHEWMRMYNVRRELFVERLTYISSTHRAAILSRTTPAEASWQRGKRPNANLSRHLRRPRTKEGGLTGVIVPSEMVWKGRLKPL